jgi:FKBP-type peptidyl-prolyl cis-trans isomerase FklB
VTPRLTLFAFVAALSAAYVLAQESLPSGAPQPQGKQAPSGQPASPPGQGAPGQAGQPAQAPPTDARHYSYAIGLEMGLRFRADKLPFDVESLVAGIRDGLAAKDPRYSPELCQAAMERLNEQQMAAYARRNQEFLVQNVKAQGVQTTVSGLQYKVIKAGAGEHPTANDTVKVNYGGQLIDGTVFDQTEPNEPATFPVNRVIPGWAEALQLMKVGDKWQLVIPPKLAYGEEGRDVIPPNSALIFEVELLAIEPPSAVEPGEPAQ